MERNGTKPNSGSQSSSTTPYVSSTSAVTQTTTSRPQQPAGSKPCHGENVSERPSWSNLKFLRGHEYQFNVEREEKQKIKHISLPLNELA